MTKIVLDTNIWIYLTKDTFYELWIKLKEMKEKNNIEIWVNDIILKEWHRNKKRTIDSLCTNIKNEFKSAKNLSNYLEGENKVSYLNTISFYNDENERIEIAKKRVTEIEKFMSKCSILRVTDEQKLFVSSLAINKEPPFQNNKNNYNDALILRNICEHAKTEMPFQYDLIFVTNNPDDFIDKTTGQIYSTLLEGLSHIRIKSVTELGQSFELAEELIEDFDDWLEYQLEREAERYFDLIRGK